MGEAIEQGAGHFRIAKNTWPFAKGEIGRDDDRGSFIEPADQMEEQLSARLSKGQIAEFVEDDEVHSGEIFREAPLTARPGLGLKPCDEFDGVENRPRFPVRMQLLAIAIERCVFPVPVPPTRTQLRC